jgi:glutamine amidotransferase-like uncharacterized protein
MIVRIAVMWLLVLAWVAPGLAEVSKTEGKIATGTEWETEYHVIDSGVDGPTVLIVGGMHGNEPAGWRAAEQIRHWPIVKGKLVVVPRANVKGLAANTRFVPDQPKGAGDLNRNFPKVEEDVQPRGELAMALWKFAGRVEPDWVIDLHEGFEFNLSHNPPDGKKKSVGSSVIYRGGNEMDPLAERIVDAANATVTEADKRFSLLRRGPVDTGLARACINVLGAEALILETTYKEQPLSLRTRQHRAMANVLLNHIGVVDRDCRDVLAAPKKDGHLLVGGFDGPGTGGSKSNLFGIVDGTQEMTLHYIGGAEMRPEVLEQFDVLVFPGGSGSKQAKAIGEKGRAAVGDFVAAGGGYLGVCAGAYLCSSHYDWSLNLIDSSVFTGSREIPGKGKKQMWYRGGSADIDMEITAVGRSIFGGIDNRVVVRYHNGPIISPKQQPDLEDYRVLAWFRSETGLWEPQKGTMIDTPAIVSGGFGDGRVISVSPHPESTEALYPIIEGSLRWVAGEEQ